MNPFEPKAYSGGLAWFGGHVRSDDEGAETFAVEIPGQAPAFGEFRCLYDDDKWEITVRIVSFGFDEKRNVRFSAWKLRKNYSNSQSATIKSLIENLFDDVPIRKEVAGFAGVFENWPITLIFEPDWIFVK